MQYQSLALGLIESQPALHRRLQRSRRLVEVMESHALDLKASHLAWIDRLAERRPGDDPQSRKSQALELALADLEERFAQEASPSGSADAP